MSAVARKTDDVGSLMQIGKIVTDITGVQFGERQLSMLTSRLTRRLIDLKINDFVAYKDYVEKHRETEVPILIGLLTTHHTAFFREFTQFEFFAQKCLPTLIEQARKRADKKIRIWSAACSRGQEVYSLAMWLEQHLRGSDVSFEVFGTDVDPDSVLIAKNGVYLYKEVKEIPLAMLNTHWTQGKGELEAYAKVRKSLRQFCNFDTHNLLKKPASPQKYDAIFCRNVFIYFTPEQIKMITSILIEQLQPHGGLFLGLSETLGGIDLPMKLEGPSIYFRKTAPAAVPAGGAPALAVAKPAAPVEPAGPLRILVVDDSPSIHTLMKQLLTAEHGFQIVGSAMNGLEAAAKLKTLKVDALTLDIHMPEQTGIEYLQKNFGSSHPPVVMVTSVARENSDMALKALELGASDYVEKPALANMKERGEEIRMKLRCAVRAARDQKQPTKLDLDRRFAKKNVIEQPETKLRVVAFNLSDRAKVRTVVKAWTSPQPPVILLIDGAGEALPNLTSLLEKDLGAKLTPYASSTRPVPGQIYTADSTTDLSRFKTVAAEKKLSVLAFGESSAAVVQTILNWPGAHLLIEDLGAATNKNPLYDAASDVGPITSFAYQSDEFLCKKP